MSGIGSCTRKIKLGTPAKSLFPDVGRNMHQWTSEMTFLGSNIWQAESTFKHNVIGSIILRKDENDDGDNHHYKFC